jgi:ABC-2 type transport system ATP-binding protein
MSDESLVQVSGLHKRYGAVHAVRGLDLTLRRGQILGLLGANGAGKTTTMAMLAGVLAPTAGSIRIAGHDLATRPMAAKARLGYLPETPPLYPELSVDEYLRHCATLRGVARTQLKAAVERSKMRCALGDSGARLLGNLSKGYRQRAGIAQAIVHDPELVILDEPTSGLDPAQLVDIRSLIRELGTQHAVVLSTHFLPEAQQVCDQVQIIHQGQFALSTPLDPLRSAQLEYRIRALDTDNQGVPIAALQALGMVTNVRLAQPTPGKRVDAGPLRQALLVSLTPDDDPDRALTAFSRACAHRDWTLLELTPLRPSLEDLFMATAYPILDGSEVIMRDAHTVVVDDTSPPDATSVAARKDNPVLNTDT